MKMDGRQQDNRVAETEWLNLADARNHAPPIGKYTIPTLIDCSLVSRGVEKVSRRSPANAIRTVKASQRTRGVRRHSLGIKNETKQRIALIGWAHAAMRKAMLSSFGEMSDSASGTITKAANKRSSAMRSVSGESPVRIQKRGNPDQTTHCGTCSSELRCRNHQLAGVEQ